MCHNSFPSLWMDIRLSLAFTEWTSCAFGFKNMCGIQGSLNTCIGRKFPEIKPWDQRLLFRPLTSEHRIQYLKNWVTELHRFGCNLGIQLPIKFYILHIFVVSSIYKYYMLMCQQIRKRAIETLCPVTMDQTAWELFFLMSHQIIQLQCS